MEVPHSIILLHSKYSPNCKRFNDLIISNGIDYIIPVCIDNKDTREKILNSMVEIQMVPSLLFVYGSGNIEKYEGENAFKWLDEIIQKKIQSEREMKIEESKQITPLQEVEVKKKKKKVIVEESSEEDEDEEDEEVIPIKKVKNKVVKVSEKYQKDEVKGTSIDDLMDINNLEEDDRDNTILSTNKNATEKIPVRENNLMMKVQEMQRMRDQEESKLPKKPF